ncbi:hypothetical protein Ccrd_020499 [Cynara cardunculus var. scolymus]|uniref:Uncharacterized protein n=1 Tax=Cynara cardunculus var. scolymus TaxID=59895 RepID=A0A124SEV0_CYNCS|nr:hypothetical protein Ccrd_020499 [Cynara cardunculus var. scolymus]
MNMNMMMKMMLVLVYLINHLDASPVYLHGRSLRLFNFNPFKLKPFRVNPELPFRFPKPKPSVDFPTVPLPLLRPFPRPRPSGKPTVEHPTTNPDHPYAKPTPLNPPDRTTRLRALTCKFACKAVIDSAVAEAGASNSNSRCLAEIAKASVQQLCTDACSKQRSGIRPTLITAGNAAFAACANSRVAGPDPPGNEYAETSNDAAASSFGAESLPPPLLLHSIVPEEKEHKEVYKHGFVPLGTGRVRSGRLRMGKP